MTRQGVVTNVRDNVATATTDIPKGTKVSMFVEENEMQVIVNQDIPFGHKFAIKKIPKGENVIKYAESIGVATKDISVGDHVHVHNVDSERGRGDLLF